MVYMLKYEKRGDDMYCRRCGNDISDDSYNCPICGFIIRSRKKNLREIADDACVTILDIMSLLSYFFNGAMLGTLAHFTVNSRLSLVYTWEIVHYNYRQMKLLHIVFGILLFTLPIFSVISRYLMRRCERKGIYIASVTHALISIWGVAYLLVCERISGTRSQFFNLCIIEAAVYALLATVMLVILFRSNKFV